jgi:2-oxoglutarate ferredoxin oxidoreductase subunit delta
MMSKGTIWIDTEQCKGCTLCTSVCPQGVITMSLDQLNRYGYRPAVLANPTEQCTGCGVCALICPDACITVFRQPIHRDAPSEVS